ncbi:GATOR2 complex protein WDR24 isoform X2 [Procambarus clarkii]|uniref:GATOR2 complex protein WDR24 isoform X2 n=1 Tax=Procambarus clarkii TaxID=6728 RepID=UPI001E676B57|nr:GATOR complex protein WDR24-like isoform X1 [Procambarus clarkii]XP_045612986.1 GATOR complex protein WDR24-like isoform X1 [Procambarus clarkii]
MPTVRVTQDHPANALALSPDNLQVVIAGRHVFKIFSIEDDDLVEKANLRTGKHLNLNFSCNDVVWNPVEDSVLATASTNGAVVTWNLNKASRSKMDCVFNDHSRTVHKVSFHPCEPHLLISGSHDGFMKLFDLRRREATQTYTSNAESVRDVQFNPHHSVNFCAVSENGNVQLWDMRRSDRVEKQFTAHGGPIFALDWHPDVKTWIATAGRDKTIKVWDLNDNPTVCNTIQTIASVGRVKWRPNTKYHIASSALLCDCSINVWDVRRPYIPLAAFNEHKNLTTGICWRADPNSLLSVGKDCTLIHHSFQDAIRPMEEVNPAALDISIYGDISNASRIKEDSEPTGSLAKLSVFRKLVTFGEYNGQVLSSVQMMTCEEDAPVSTHHLVESAKQYLLTGRSLAEICEHNSGVAKKLNRHQVSLTWQMLQMLYVGVGGSDHLSGLQGSNRDDPTIQPDTSLENEQRSSRHFSGGDAGGDTSGGGFSAEEGETETDDTDNHDLKLTNIASGMTINQDFFFGDGEINQIPFDYDNLNNMDTSQDWTLPNEAFEPRHDILHRSAIPLQEFSSKCSPREIQDTGGVSGYVMETPSLLSEVRGTEMPAWGCSELVVEMLYYYANHGDVQMSVTCVIVLGDRLKELLDPDQVEHWFLSYIDLLQRFQLWNVSNQVIQLAEGLPSVLQQNQQSTTVALNCGRCNHALGWNSLLCRKCGCASATCALCHGIVRGLFVWCQGCSHGGHLQHMMQWMANNKSCPAGCGHLCEYT